MNRILWSQKQLTRKLTVVFPTTSEVFRSRSFPTMSKSVNPTKSEPLVVSCATDGVQTLHKTKPVKMGVGIGTTIVLTPAEIKRCYLIAKARNDSNVAGNRTNCRFASKRDDVMISFQGMCGEYAMLKMFELDDAGIDDTTCRNYMTDSFDANMDGHTVDVKTVLRPGLDIIVSEWKSRNPAGLFAMMLLTGLRNDDMWREDFKLSVTFIGLCCSSWILQPENIERKFAEQKEFYVWPNNRLVTWDALMRKQTYDEMNKQKAVLMAEFDKQQQVDDNEKTKKITSGSMWF